MPPKAARWISSWVKFLSRIKNIFFYAVEAENIYILGDFDVCHDGEQVSHMSWYALEPDRFVLRAPSRRIYADITAQNAWFYRGDVRYTFRLPRQSEGKRVFLEALSPDCTLAKVLVNGQETGVMMTRPYRLEITRTADRSGKPGRGDRLRT